ncbi:MAG: A24 family peptidase [Candidatus Nanohaloarchaea archaeon]
MLILLSHAAAFSALFVASVWDLKTTEVPDPVSLFGIIAGVGLHATYAYIHSAPEALYWSLGVGAVFSIYGWAMYYLGMWGGADALGMGVLGFAAPFGLSGINALYPVDLFLNLMIAGFIYTAGFAAYQAYRTEDVFASTYRRIIEQEKRVGLEILAAAVFATVLQLTGAPGWLYFLALVFMVFFYRFLKVIEQDALVRTVKVDELEGGEVPVEGQGLGDRVKGLREEDIAEIEQEEIDVKSGVRFVPVFPVALVMTDVLGVGVTTLLALL